MEICVIKQKYIFYSIWWVGQSTQKNGIFIISDEDGNTFLIRLAKDENGVMYTNWECKVVLNDTIRVCGRVGKFTTSNATSIPSIQSGVLTIIAHEHIYGEATCTEGPTCRCGHVNGEANCHKDENGDDVCDVCKFNMNLKSSSLAIVTNDTATTGTSRTWENDVFSVTVEKGTATGFDLTSNAYMKLRKGNTATFTGKNGTKISQIVITSTTNTYGAPFATAFESVEGATVTIEDNVITVVFEEAVESVTVTLAKSARVANVEILY